MEKYLNLHNLSEQGDNVKDLVKKVGLKIEIFKLMFNTWNISFWDITITALLTNQVMLLKSPQFVIK